MITKMVYAEPTKTFSTRNKREFKDKLLLSRVSVWLNVVFVLVFFFFNFEFQL